MYETRAAYVLTYSGFYTNQPMLWQGKVDHRADSSCSSGDSQTRFKSEIGANAAASGAWWQVVA